LGALCTWHFPGWLLGRLTICPLTQGAVLSSLTAAPSHPAPSSTSSILPTLPKLSYLEAKSSSPETLWLLRLPTRNREGPSLQLLFLSVRKDQRDPTQNPDYRTFGGAISMEGTNLLVGAYRTEGNTGAASFFDCSTDPCTEYPLPVPAGTSGFGISVALNGPLAVIGAHLENNDAGAVYWYNCSSLPCSQQARIASPFPPPARFGVSLSLNGDWLALSGSGINRVILFNCPSPSSCALNKTFVPSNSDPSFGWWISLSDSLLSAASYSSTSYLNAFVARQFSFPLPLPLPLSFCPHYCLCLSLLTLLIDLCGL